MTKEELKKHIVEDKKMLEDILPMSDGQGCPIYKARKFSVSDEIIYIPDIWLNNLNILYSDDDDDGISYAQRVVEKCYTGRDFVAECDGDVELAERLFYYCDWQHPSSALPEVDDREEQEQQPQLHTQLDSEYQGKEFELGIEELNQALLYKMEEEQGQYRDWLLVQSPKDILSHAYAYAIREDILMEMEELDLPERAAAALLESTTPLADVFEDFRNRDGHMDHVRECIEDLANSLLEAKREATRSIPLYQQTGEYAREHGELDAFRASRKANIACREAIESAISEGFDGMYLTADTKSVLAEFGPERVSYVLAATLQNKTWDERFSRNNQAWAASVPMVEPQDRRSAYIINSHSTLLDSFVSTMRKELDAMRDQKSQAAAKPSIKEQLAAKPVPGDRPDKPHDKGAR